MLKSKLEFKIPFDTPKGKDSWYFHKYNLYGVSLGRIHQNITRDVANDVDKDFIWDTRANKVWRNITYSKNQGMNAWFMLYASAGPNVGDAFQDYDKCLFLPIYQSIGYSSSISGIKRPIGAKYPALIDFDTTAYLSTLLAYKQRANKSNSLFSQTYKQHIIKSTSTILARYLTRQDKLYLNPLDFNFYDKDTHQKYTGYVPDEHIFRPFNSYDITKTKQQILREWNDFKYYGSNLMLPKFIPNETKKQEYLNSLVNENEELISVEELNYDKTNKDDLTRLVLQETLGEHYDFNDNLEFSIDNNTYRLDIHKEQFLDSEGNVLPYIAKYSSNNNLESIISFKEYKSILKETLTELDTLITSQVKDNLLNNKDISEIVSDYKNYYLDTDKDGKKYVWFGSKIQVSYTYTKSEGKITSTGTETIEYTLDELKEKINTSITPIQLKEAINYAYQSIQGNEFNLTLSKKASNNETITININRKLGNQITDLSIRKWTNSLFYYNNLIFNSTSTFSVYYEFYGGIKDINFIYSETRQITYNQLLSLKRNSYEVDTNRDVFFGLICNHIYNNINRVYNTNSVNLGKLGNFVGQIRFENNIYEVFKFENIIITGFNNLCLSNQFMYEYSDGTVSIVLNTSKELVKTYSFYEYLLQIFGGIYTNIQNIDKSNADYNTTKTYLHELNYTEGEVWDIVDIQPIFVISGVLSKDTTKLNTSELTYQKKILTDEEKDSLNENQYLIDNEGNAYQIDIIGEVYNPPIEISQNSIDDEGNPKVETILMSKSSLPRANVSEQNIEEYIKFSLPRRQLKIYSKVSNYISKLKSNQITGYLVKYLDKTDNKTKIRLHNISAIEWQQNTCDLEYKIVKCLPLVPLWTQMITLDAIQIKIFDLMNPLSWFPTSLFNNVNRMNNFLGYQSFGYNISTHTLKNEKEANKLIQESYTQDSYPTLIVNEPDVKDIKEYIEVMKKCRDTLKPLTSAKDLDYSKPIWLSHRASNLKGFYQFYNKKINKYYKDLMNFNLKEWEQTLNGYWEDKEYNVKMKKKLSKRFTNPNSIVYSESMFSRPYEIDSDDSYRSRGTSFGYHTAIRFNFAIFFNKHFRKTRLISIIGYKYLDYFYKQLNGQYGQWIEQILYPPDRIQFIEKRVTIRFMKQQYDTSIEGNEASQYCVLNSVAGTFTFYNRLKKEKFVFDINTYCPKWRSLYFNGINTYNYGNQIKTLPAEDRLGLYTITKNDIQTLNTRYRQTNVYFRSLYYNTPSIINKIKQNTWTRTTLDYTCFYTPHTNDLDKYKWTNEEIEYTLNNFKQRNVYDYLFDKLKVKSSIELKDIYLNIFGKEIEVLPYSSPNIFNYNGIFDNLVLEAPNEELFQISNEEQYSKVLDFSAIPYQQIPNISKSGLALTQSYALNKEYNENQLVETIIDTDTIKSAQVAIKEIIYYLLDNELPLFKWITAKEFKEYFINYSTDNKLASIFTSYEIYQLGFENFLVTNDTDRYELTILLEQIQSINSNLISKLDTKEGIIEFNSVWLPMPVDVFKRLPVYSKNLCSTLFFNMEIYNVSVLPSVNTKEAEALLTYQSMQIVTAIIIAIVSLCVSIFFPPSGGAGIAFLVISIVGATLTIIAMIIQLVALFLPANISKKLSMASQILSYIGAVFSMIGSFGNIGSLTSTQIANIALMSINLAISIGTKVTNAIYDNKMLKENKRYNEKVDEYNKEIEATYEFIKENEFEGNVNLLNQYHPINIRAKEISLFDDNYDALVEVSIEQSLNLLYTDLNSYYDVRLD